MATSHKIFVDAQNIGLWRKVKQTDEAAGKVTELLQKDLETHHVFFNHDGFHNHIVHHLLSLYGTGANPTQLQKAFDDNASYQRAPMPPHQSVVEDLLLQKTHKDDDDDGHHQSAARYLGKEQYYPDFLAFFQREMDGAGGWQAVLSEHVLAGTERADDLLVRLHGGIMHPLIQLMYGVEWGQPAVVAEGLAQACVHGAELGGMLLGAESGFAGRVCGDGDGEGNAGGERSMPSIVSLLREAHDVPALARVEDSSGGRLSDWTRKGPPDEMMGIIKKVKVRPEEVEERTAEMFDAVMFAAAGASFHPKKVNKFNFFLIHYVNVAPLYLTINSQPWITLETKARLLEWKIRLDLFHYAAIGAPDISLDKIKAYEPKDPATMSVAEILSRYHSMEDEGHAVKLARTAAICQEVSKKYEDREWMMIKGDDTWMKVHHLILDSLDGPKPRWVFSQGLDEAWRDVPDKLKL